MRPGRGLSLALAATAAQLAADAIATLLDRNLWPACSYNMFNDAFDDGPAALVVDVLTPAGWDDGHSAGATFPVPFFRATEVYEHVVLSGEPVEAVRFAHRVLDRLNTRSWRAFDEIRRSAAVSRPVHGLRVRVLEHRMDGETREHLAFEHRCPDFGVCPAR